MKFNPGDTVSAKRPLVDFLQGYHIETGAEGVVLGPSEFAVDYLLPPTNRYQVEFGEGTILDVKEEDLN